MYTHPHSYSHTHMYTHLKDICLQSSSGEERQGEKCTQFTESVSTVPERAPSDSSKRKLLIILNKMTKIFRIYQF